MATAAARPSASLRGVVEDGAAFVGHVRAENGYRCAFLAARGRTGAEKCPGQIEITAQADLSKSVSWVDFGQGRFCVGRFRKCVRVDFAPQQIFAWAASESRCTAQVAGAQMIPLMTPTLSITYM